MKSIIMFESDDGQVFKTEKEALQADNAYWKALGLKQLAQQKLADEEYAKRQPYHEREGHQ